MRSGPTATRLGLDGLAASAELTIIERDLTLAAETGGWVHFTHLSTARRARRDSASPPHGVTGDV